MHISLLAAEGRCDNSCAIELLAVLNLIGQLPKPGELLSPKNLLFQSIYLVNRKDNSSPDTIHLINFPRSVTDRGIFGLKTHRY